MEPPGSGRVDRSRVKHLAQHELDTANRLARLGLTVVFRPPQPGSTEDVFVNGVKVELKWSRSSQPGTIQKRITGKRRAQGPRFVLDITESPMPIAEAAALTDAVVHRYSDSGVKSVLVIDQALPDGKVQWHMSGEEVTQWRL